MKKVFFFTSVIVYVLIATPLFPSKAESPVEQLVGIMVPNPTSSRDEWQEGLGKLILNRNPEDYERVYELATKYPELLSGIVYNRGTLAMLCIKRGYLDLLECLIDQGYPVDLATPCYLLGFDNPPTTVLYELIIRIWFIRNHSWFCNNQAINESIIRLTKLIIRNNPDLLDITFPRTWSPRQKIQENDLNDLIPPELRQNAN